MQDENTTITLGQLADALHDISATTPSVSPNYDEGFEAALGFVAARFQVGFSTELPVND